MPADNSQIGTEYLRIFFAQVEDLSEYTATYKNVLVEIQSKANADENFKTASKMDTEEKKRLWFQVQSVRYLVTRIDIKLRALSQKVPEFKELDFAALKAARDKIRDTTIPDFSDVEYYAQEVNKLLVIGIFSQFLEGSGQGYSSFVSGNQGNEGGQL